MLSKIHNNELMLCFEFFSLFLSPLSPWYMHFSNLGMLGVQIKASPRGLYKPNEAHGMRLGMKHRADLYEKVYIYISLKWGTFGQALKQCFSAQCCCGRHLRLLLISKCPVSFWEVLECKLEHFASQILIHLSSVTN